MFHLFDAERFSYIRPGPFSTDYYCIKILLFAAAARGQNVASPLLEKKDLIFIKALHFELDH